MPKGSLHNKFDGFGSIPSDEVWNGIANSLDDKKKRRAIILWWTGIGIAASFLLFLGFKTMYSSESPHSKDSEIVTIPVDSADSSTSETSHKNVSNHIDQKQHPLKINDAKSVMNLIKVNLDKKLKKDIRSPQKNLAFDLNKKLKKDQNPIRNMVDTASNNDLDLMVNNDQNKFTLEGEKKSEITYLDKIEIDAFPIELDSQALNYVDYFKAPKQREKWHFALMAQTSLSSNGRQRSDELLFTSISPPPGIGSSDPFITRESRPIAIRLNASKTIKNRLSFKTGLDLGLVISKSSKQYSTDFRNAFDLTLGIPLGLSYALVEKKRIGLELSAGLTNDLIIYNKTRESITQANNTQAFESANGIANINSKFFGGSEVDLSLNYYLNDDLQVVFSPGLKHFYKLPSAFDQRTFITFGAGLKWLF